MTAPDIVVKWSTCTPQLQGVLRIVAAFIFMLSGTMKLFAFPAGIPPHGGTVPLMSQLGLGGILEVFGGGLLLLGLFTRPIRLPPIGRNGGGVLPVPFPAGLLADHEWRHPRRALLLPLALLLGRRRRALEPRRHAGT
jgi:hypothetical protein